MNRISVSYFWICLLIIITGIFSRKTTIIPVFVGDILYACLLYFGFRFLFPKQNQSNAWILSLLFCFGIEFSQLINWTWLVNLRKSTLGHYILGEGFLISDLLSYFLGTFGSYCIDLYGLKLETYRRG